MKNKFVIVCLIIPFLLEIRMEEINMKELENVMSKLEKATKKKEQMDNQIKLLKQREKKC